MAAIWAQYNRADVQNAYWTVLPSTPSEGSALAFFFERHAAEALDYDADADSELAALLSSAEIRMIGTELARWKIDYTQRQGLPVSADQLTRFKQGVAGEVPTVVAFMAQCEATAGLAGLLPRIAASGGRTALEVVWSGRDVEANVFRNIRSSTANQRSVSLNRLRSVLGRAGVSPSPYYLRKASSADYALLLKQGADPNDVYAWVSRDGSGNIITDRKGRPIITFTKRGLSSLEEAVKSYGHEVHHIKDFVAGRASSEAAAEAAGEELWKLIFGRMSR